MDSARVKELVRQHWARRAAEFDRGPTHGLLSDQQRQTWSARLARWAGPSAVDVLDIGCGTGFLALQLAALGHRAVGLDAADAMLDCARAKAQQAGLPVSFQAGDAEQLPFAAGAFDLLVERHLIWTLPEPDRALRDWRRVLRRGGRVILVEGDWRRDGAPRTDEYRGLEDALPLYGGRPAAELRERLAAAGFVELEVEPLMDAALWGGPPDVERYALHGRAPR